MRRIDTPAGARYEMPNGDLLTEEEFDDYLEAIRTDGPCSLSSVPEMHSEALAVHPRQIGKATADAKKHGVPTEFDGHGRPIFTSRDHQRRYAQVYGFVNKDDNWSGKNYGLKPQSNEDMAKEIFDG